MKKYSIKLILFITVIILSSFFVKTAKGYTVCLTGCGSSGAECKISFDTSVEQVPTKAEVIKDTGCIDFVNQATCPSPCPTVTPPTTPTVTPPASTPASVAAPASASGPAVKNPTPATTNIPVTKLQNPLDPTGKKGEAGLNLMMVIGDITNYALGIIGSITLLVFAYGGFMWLTAAGNAEHVKKGSTAMLWAVIGLFIVFGSYVILKTVILGILGTP